VINPTAYDSRTWSDTMIRDSLYGLVDADLESMSRDELIAAIPIANEVTEKFLLRMISLDLIMNGWSDFDGDKGPAGIMNS